MDNNNINRCTLQQVQINSLIFSWDNIVARFEEAFLDVFTTASRKAHFDALPRELKVVDGARDRWCPLLLLDAMHIATTVNLTCSTTRRAFNQHAILEQCVLAELQSLDPARSNTAEMYEVLRALKREYSAINNSIATSKSSCIDDNDMDSDDSEVHDATMTSAKACSGRRNNNNCAQQRERRHLQAMRLRNVLLHEKKVFLVQNSSRLWNSNVDFRDAALRDPPCKAKHKFEAAVFHLADRQCLHLLQRPVAGQRGSSSQSNPIAPVQYRVQLSELAEMTVACVMAKLETSRYLPAFTNYILNSHGRASTLSADNQSSDNMRYVDQQPVDMSGGDLHNREFTHSTSNANDNAARCYNACDTSMTNMTIANNRRSRNASKFSHNQRPTEDDAAYMYDDCYYYYDQPEPSASSSIPSRRHSGYHPMAHGNTGSVVKASPKNKVSKFLRPSPSSYVTTRRYFQQPFYHDSSTSLEEQSNFDDEHIDVDQRCIGYDNDDESYLIRKHFTVPSHATDYSHYATPANTNNNISSRSRQRSSFNRLRNYSIPIKYTKTLTGQRQRHSQEGPESHNSNSSDNHNSRWFAPHKRHSQQVEHINAPQYNDLSQQQQDDDEDQQSLIDFDHSETSIFLPQCNSATTMTTTSRSSLSTLTNAKTSTEAPHMTSHYSANHLHLHCLSPMSNLSLSPMLLSLSPPTIDGNVSTNSNSNDNNSTEKQQQGKCNVIVSSVDSSSAFSPRCPSSNSNSNTDNCLSSRGRPRVLSAEQLRVPPSVFDDFCMDYPCDNNPL